MGVQQLMLYLMFNISKQCMLQSSKSGYAYITRCITTASATPPATVCASCVRYSTMDSTNKLIALQMNSFAHLPLFNMLHAGTAKLNTPIVFQVLWFKEVSGLYWKRGHKGLKIWADVNQVHLMSERYCSLIAISAKRVPDVFGRGVTTEILKV